MGRGRETHRRWWVWCLDPPYTGPLLLAPCLRLQIDPVGVLHPLAQRLPLVTKARGGDLQFVLL